MYFTLPTSHERQKQKTSLSKKASSSSLASTDSSVMAEDRISEIIRNLDDHWGSPPILTPDTLAHILNNQWVTSDEEELKKVSKVAAAIVNKQKNITTSRNIKVISTLIEEFCKTIEDSNKNRLAQDIKSDPIIQKFLSFNESKQLDDLKEDIPREEYVMNHLIQLLQTHNRKKE